MITLLYMSNESDLNITLMRNLLNFFRITHMIKFYLTILSFSINNSNDK